MKSLPCSRENHPGCSHPNCECRCHRLASLDAYDRAVASGGDVVKIDRLMEAFVLASGLEMRSLMAPRAGPVTFRPLGDPSAGS